MKKSWRISGATGQTLAALAAAFLLGACSDNVDDSAPETPTITGITITDGETAVGEDGVTLDSTTATKDLTVTVTGTGEFDKTFTAATSAEGVATVAVKEDGSGITVTGIAAGEATITVTATGDNTKTATVKVTVPESTTPEPQPTWYHFTVSAGSGTNTARITLTNAVETGTHYSIYAAQADDSSKAGEYILDSFVSSSDGTYYLANDASLETALQSVGIENPEGGQSYTLYFFLRQGTGYPYEFSPDELSPGAEYTFTYPLSVPEFSVIEGEYINVDVTESRKEHVVKAYSRDGRGELSDHLGKPAEQNLLVERCQA